MPLFNQHNLNVAKIASKDTSRPVYASVFFTPTKTVCTDSYRLLEVSVRKDQKVEEYPITQGHSPMRGFEPFLVPVKGLRKIDLPKNKIMPILNNLAIKHVDKDKVKFLKVESDTAQITQLRRIDDKFPDYEQIFPAGEPVAEIKINGKWLADMLDIMAGVSGATADVTLKFYAKNKPLVLVAGNAHQTARGLIMEIKV